GGEQLELQPSARDRGRHGRAQLPDQRRHRTPGGVARRGRVRRRDGRGVGAGDPGAGSDGAAAWGRGPPRRRAHRRARNRTFSPAKRGGKRRLLTPSSAEARSMHPDGAARKLQKITGLARNKKSATASRTSDFQGSGGPVAAATHSTER